LEQATAGLLTAEVRDPVGGEEYPLLLRAADALLVHERSTVRDMSLPSKLTSYFAAGRPVVAMVSRDSATAAELEHSGGGLVVDRDDPAALATALGRLRAEPEEQDRFGAAGIAYAHEALRPAVGLGRLARLISEVLPDGTEHGERHR
jgi:glycosyltransferase involved in cell wall biosynthesis